MSELNYRVKNPTVTRKTMKILLDRIEVLEKIVLKKEVAPKKKAASKKKED